MQLRLLTTSIFISLGLSSVFAAEDQKKHRQNPIHLTEFAVKKTGKPLPKAISRTNFLKHFEGDLFLQVFKKGNDLGFHYQDGLNELLVNHETPQSYKTAGFVFTTLENIHRYYQYGDYIRIVRTIDNSTIHPYPCGTKFKTTKIFLVRELSLTQVQNYNVGNLNNELQSKLELSVKRLEPSNRNYALVIIASNIFYQTFIEILNYGISPLKKFPLEQIEQYIGSTVSAMDDAVTDMCSILENTLGDIIITDIKLSALPKFLQSTTKDAIKKQIPLKLAVYDAYFYTKKIAFKYVVENFDNIWKKSFEEAEKTDEIYHCDKYVFTDKQKSNPFLMPFINALEIVAKDAF